MSWERAANGTIPHNALMAGYEGDGSPLYIARAEHEGGQHPGKVNTKLGAAHFGFNGQEVIKRDYEVLCCDPRQLACVHWVKMEKGETLPAKAWVAGRESDGNDLYIARAKIHGGLHVGKAGHHLKGGMSVSHGGKEHSVAPYEVLVFTDQLRESKMILGGPRLTAT